MELPLIAHRRAFIAQSARCLELPTAILGALDAVQSPITDASAGPSQRDGMQEDDA